MPSFDMTPGLTAWERRHRRVRRGQRRHVIILMTGLAGAVAYVTPPSHNPLVYVGILEFAQTQPDVPMPTMMLAIPIRDSDLPKQRPSLATAHAADQIEEAHVIGVISQAVPTTTAALPARIDSDDLPDLNRFGSSPPLFAIVETLEPKPSVFAPARRPIPEAVQVVPTKPPDEAKPKSAEDFNETRKRAFNSDR
jgi:hypothetical protein